MNGCNSGSARSSSVSSRRAAEPCKPSSLSAVSTACLAFSLPCACPLRPRRVPEFFSFALGIRGIILFCLPAGNVLHSSVSLIFYHQTVTGHGLGDFGFCLQFFQSSSPPIGQRPVSMSAMYLRIGNTCGGETALPSVFIRLLRFGTSSVRREMSAGSSAQRECPSICAGNPSATLPSPG